MRSARSINEINVTKQKSVSMFKLGPSTGRKNIYTNISEITGYLNHVRQRSGILLEASLDIWMKRQKFHFLSALIDGHNIFHFNYL